MFDGAYPPGVTGNEPEIAGIDDWWIPDPCCKFCTMFDGDYCTKEWNNADEDYCDPDRDARDECDSCDDYEWNGEYNEYPEHPKKPDKEHYKYDWQYRRAMNHYMGECRRWASLMEKIRLERRDEW